MKQTECAACGGQGHCYICGSEGWVLLDEREAALALELSGGEVDTRGRESEIIALRHKLQTGSEPA